MKLLNVRVIFEPRDFWIGVYFAKPTSGLEYDYYRVYVCLVPMFPIVFKFGV